MTAVARVAVVVPAAANADVEAAAAPAVGHFLAGVFRLPGVAWAAGFDWEAEARLPAARQVHVVRVEAEVLVAVQI